MSGDEPITSRRGPGDDVPEMLDRARAVLDLAPYVPPDLGDEVTAP